MEIKLKLSEVMEINNTLKTIIDDKGTKLDVILKFRLLGVLKAVESHILNFETIKNEKIMEYGKKNKDGLFQIQKSDTNAIAKFKKDIEQMLDNEILINVELFKPAELIDRGLRSDYLIGLYPLIRE